MTMRSLAISALLPVLLAACAVEQAQPAARSQALDGELVVQRWDGNHDTLWPRDVRSAVVVLTPGAYENVFLAYGVVPDTGEVLWAYEVARADYGAVAEANAREWQAIGTDGFQSAFAGAIGGRSPPGDGPPTGGEGVSRELVQLVVDTAVAHLRAMESMYQ